jgi:hypothetical protein
VERAIDEGEEPAGQSLAGRWVRGRLAVLRASEAAGAGSWAAAFQSYDRAFQYTGEAAMLFEAALSASKAEDWQAASKKYSQYLAIGAEDISPDRAFQVQAEVDRIGSILEGLEPVERESLADRVHRERAGDLEPEEPPPTPVAPEEADAGTEPEPVEIGATEAEEVGDIVEIGEDPAQAKAAARKAALEEKKAAEKAAREAKAAAEAPVKEPPKGGYSRTEPTEPAAFAAALVPPERPAEVAPRPPGRREVTVDDLVFYSRSRSPSVRMRAVKDLVSVPGERARAALEERLFKDTNMQVRFAAIGGLAARRSFASLPALRSARVTAATSEERAVLKEAIDEIVESRR